MEETNDTYLETMQDGKIAGLDESGVRRMRRTYAERTWGRLQNLRFD